MTDEELEKLSIATDRTGRGRQAGFRDLYCDIYGEAGRRLRFSDIVIFRIKVQIFIEKHLTPVPDRYRAGAVSDVLERGKA